MNKNAINFVLTAKDRVSYVLEKIGGRFRTFGKAALAPLRMVGRAMKRLLSPVFSLKGAIVGLFTAWGGIRIVKSAISAFNKADAAMRGLSSVANAVAKKSREMGSGMAADAETARAAAVKLAEDGLMTISESALALKNLLLSGFGLDQAVEMINRVKDAAAFGRQGALSFADAVISATEGIKNENSILVDNAGITKNLSIMHKEFAASVGKTVSELSKAERLQAVYNGVIKEAQPMLGDTAKLTETFQGKTAALRQTWEIFMEEIGRTITPALGEFVDNGLKPLVKQATAWLKVNQEMIASKLSDWLAKVVEWIKALAQWIQDGGLVDAWNNITAAVKNFTGALRELTNYWNQNKSVLQTMAGMFAGAAVGGAPGAIIGGVAGFTLGSGNNEAATWLLDNVIPDPSVSRNNVQKIETVIYSGVPDPTASNGGF